MPKPHSSSGSRTAEQTQAPHTIRVLVSAQHALVRAGIRALLQQMVEVEVVGEVADTGQALQLIKDQQPELVLLDVIMPSMGALESLREIVTTFPHVRVIVLTLQQNEEYAVQAIRAGATGYISKHASSMELEMAIKAVASGEKYLASELSQQAVLRYLQDPRAFFSELTVRQREVLKMIADSHPTKEIARRLGISVKTVETHRAQIMERLDIHDIAGLVRYALRMGMIKLEE